MEAAAGEQRADDIRKRERANVRGVNFFQMVGAGRLQFNRQSRCASVCELLGVDARDQAAGAPCRQNFARLRDSKCAAIAEHVAKFSQARHGDCRNPAVDKQIHVRISGAGDIPQVPRARREKWSGYRVAVPDAARKEASRILSSLFQSRP